MPHPDEILTDIQAGKRPRSVHRPAGRVTIVGSGTRSSSLFDRLKCHVTPCPLITLAAGATPGGWAALLGTKPVLDANVGIYLRRCLLASARSLRPVRE